MSPRTVALVLGILAMTTPARAYDWTQFNGNPQHSGNNTRETIIGSSNVASLVSIFQATLPAVCDGVPVYLDRVGTSSGARDLLFAATVAGDLVALDAHSGAIVWTKSNPAGTCKINNGSSTCYTTASPAIDPSRFFVYTYGLDGKVHKYRVGDGLEITDGGWPQTATLKPFDEKGSSNLATAVAADGTPYLYVCNGGYPGDNGDYQGHVTAINLASGVQRVFNAACSDEAVHFAEKPGTPDCAHVQTAIWARSGAVYDSVTNRLFVATGNGDYDGNSMGHDWGDSVLALNPNGTGISGKPLDAYTPANYQQLQDSDADLGSTAPAILPAPGFTGRLGLQSGKDATLRLIRLDDLSGHGAPGFTGGALQTIAVPQGGEVFSAPAVWKRSADGSTWVFVGNGSGTSALRLTASGSSASLSTQWTKASQPAFSPLVANGILFSAAGGIVRAVTPETGGILWSDSSSVGSIHWQSPVVANGILYLADGARHLTAWAPALSPVSISVDAHAPSGSSSNVNGVLDPGEVVQLAPAWRNFAEASAAPGGTLSQFTGPSGATYTLADSAAAYNAIAHAATGSCLGSPEGCYLVGVSDPAVRPSAHWDAGATETLAGGGSRRWTLHVGRTFTDVPPSETFYAAIEALIHQNVTMGCGTRTFCPLQTVTRGQIAAFLARSAFGGDAAVPAAGRVPGVGSYACRNGGVSLFSDVSATDPFCRHIHWLAAGGRSFGCTEAPSYASTWCPDSAISRGTLAEILARDLAGGNDTVPSSANNAGNGRAYDCTDGQPNFFSDVVDSDPLCRFVYFIWSRGVVDGYADQTYRPSTSVSRDQMAKFLVNALAPTPF